jgi:hypothetical protein
MVEVAFFVTGLETLQILGVFEAFEAFRLRLGLQKDSLLLLVI